MRLLAIGDIHGCARALERLLERVAPTRADRVVTLGDYVNKGHDARGVLATLRGLASATRLVPLLGNHDSAFREALEQAESLYLRSFGARTLASYGLDHLSAAAFPAADLEFLRACPTSYETEAHLFAHANALPDLPLSAQGAGSLLLERLRASQGPHGSGKTLVCGHTAQISGRILDLGHTLGIDTYACGGGWLTCLELGSGRIWQANEAGAVREGQRGDPRLCAGPELGGRDSLK